MRNRTVNSGSSLADEETNWQGLFKWWWSNSVLLESPSVYFLTIHLSLWDGYTTRWHFEQIVKTEARSRCKFTGKCTMQEGWSHIPEVVPRTCVDSIRCLQGWNDKFRGLKFESDANKIPKNWVTDKAISREVTENSQLPKPIFR